jgi:ornithine carbamoyltransferase
VSRHLLTLSDWTADEVEAVLELAARVKADPDPWRHALQGKVLAMVFQKPSTRTRVSFEVGMLRLGGHALYLGANDLQLGRGETVADTGRVLSRYADAIMARVFDQADVEALTEGTVPVISGLSDTFHPCQALADMLTLREHLGALRGRTLAYLGDGNNVLHSLALASAHTGLRLRAACPPRHSPDPAVIAEARALGGDIEIGEDPVAAVTGADAVYTDTWTPMHADQRKTHPFAGYTVDDRMMSFAAPDAVFMHCLPAHRGQEVTDAVLDGPRSIVLDQAENRMHAQIGVLLTLMGAAG